MRRYSWKIWIATIVFAILEILNFIRIDRNSHSVSDTLRPWFIDTILLVAIFFIINYFINKFKK